MRLINFFNQCIASKYTSSMTSKPKSKGNSFEREVAKFLSALYSESFIRNNSGSGAYIGGVNVHRKSTLTEGQIRHSKGDIIPPESWLHFNAEAKFYSDFTFHQLFERCQQIESWLDQLMTVADSDDVSILLMKFNRKGRYIAVQANREWNTECNFLRYTSVSWGDWMIYSFDNFFKLNRDQLKTFSTL